MKALGKLASVFLLAITGSSQAADIKHSIAACSAISGDLERLECFDNLSKSHGLASPQPVKTNVKNIGKWMVRSEKNPIDDSTTASASLEATGSHSKWDKPITLVLRCKSGKAEAYIIWQEYLGSDSAAVLARIGQADAQSEEWPLSSDNTSTFYPGDTITFFGNLIKEAKFIAQVTPYSESPRTAIFDLRGIKNAIRPVLDTCAP
ncbi:MAG: type VI secretion protein [Elusimicrobia bacterium]|nr:type VI secretion protein [Elusimicrobiota bacterium]